MDPPCSGVMVEVPSNDRIGVDNRQDTGSLGFSRLTTCVSTMRVVEKRITPGPQHFMVVGYVANLLRSNKKTRRAQGLKKSLE